MRLVALALVAVVAAALSACGISSWDNGKALATPQPGMPCGAAYHACGGDDGGANGMCCGNGWACESGGACEDTGDDGFGAAQGRPRRTVPQTPARDTWR